MALALSQLIKLIRYSVVDSWASQPSSAAGQRAEGYVSLAGLDSQSHPPLLCYAAVHGFARSDTRGFCLQILRRQQEGPARGYSDRRTAQRRSRQQAGHNHVRRRQRLFLSG